MVVRELITKLGFDVDESKLRQYNRMVKQSAEVLNKVGRNMTLFVSLPLVALGGFSLKAASDLEQLGVAFTTMLGDAEKADVFIRDLLQFASKTPFEIENIGPVAKQLLAVGFSAEEVLPTLKSVGDVAAGVGAPLDRLILNLGQVRTQGKLTGRELRDFAVNGVPLLESLADSMGKSKKEVGELVSKGMVSFDQVMEAFRGMSGEGGRFANLMDKQAKTLGGRWSNLKDATFTARAELGFAIVDALNLKRVIEFLADSLDSLVEWFKGLAKWQKNVIVFFGLFVAAIGPVLLALGGVLLFVSFLITNGAVILGILSAVGTALGAIAASVLTILLPALVIFLILEDFLRWTQGYPSIFGMMVGPVEEFMDNVVFWIDRIKVAAVKIIDDVKKDWLEFVENVVFWLNKIPLLGKKITGVLDATATVLGEGAAAATVGRLATGAVTNSSQSVVVQGGDITVNMPPGTSELQANLIAGMVAGAVDASLRSKSRQIEKSTQANE